MKRPLRLLMVVGAVLPFVLLQSDAVRGALVSVMEYMRDAGIGGVLIFLGLEVIAGVLILPIWLMAAIAGYIYGFPGGILLAIPGVTLAGFCGFISGKFIFSRGFKPVFIQGPYWIAIQRAVTIEGFKVMMLLRITPVVPQNFLHYLVASTSISPKHFLLGTSLGLLPVTILQVYIGSLVKSAAELISGEASVGGPLRWVAPVLAVLFTVIAGVWLARVGRQMLRETLDAAEEQGVTDKLSQRSSPL